MKQIHLSECSSTQTLLEKKIEQKIFNNLPLLISTSRQKEGKGRRQNQWIHLDNALAFSLTFKPHVEPTLTPLEIASILIKYFQQQQYQLYLKWPNDLLNSHGQKCGGILCTFLTEKIIIVGIGLNQGKIDGGDVIQNIIMPGSIDDKRVLSERDKQKLPLDISQYLIKNRMPSEQVIHTWNRYCSHLNKDVHIVDDDREIIGLFQGITLKGEAIIKNNGKQEYVTAGSLYCNKADISVLKNQSVSRKG